MIWRLWQRKIRPATVQDLMNWAIPSKIMDSLDKFCCVGVISADDSPEGAYVEGNVGENYDFPSPSAGDILEDETGTLFLCLTDCWHKVRIQSKFTEAGFYHRPMGMSVGRWVACMRQGEKRKAI